MADYLVRATAANDFVRAFAVTTARTAETARKHHDLSPIASAALGRTMSAALMMGADLKGDKDIMTLQFVGDGPLGGITVTSNSHGSVKGFVGNPSVMLPPNQYGKLDVGGAVGQGLLHVLKDIGLKEPYAGEVEIRNGEIAEDLSYYFAVSEQIPSVVALGVLVNTADCSVRCSGGYIIQLMPDCPEEVIEQLERACTTADPVTTMLNNGETPETILEKLLGPLGMHITEQMPVKFECDCSKERVTKALIAMGPRELKSLIEEGKPVSLNCHFCNTDYEFQVDELKVIFKAAMDKLTGRDRYPAKKKPE